jgi:hypothetical protein
VVPDPHPLGSVALDQLRGHRERRTNGFVERFDRTVSNKFFQKAL